MSLKLISLQFVLRSQGMLFPAFSGSAWHGGLGMMLQSLHPQAFSELYSVAPESRLYAIYPQHGEKIESGEACLLRITLFGTAVIHVMAVCEAISALGQIGIRPGGKFDVETVHVLGSSGWQQMFDAKEGLILQPQASALSDLITIAPQHASRLRLALRTPLRIKEGNQLLQTPPRFDQLIRRTLGRLEQLVFSSRDESPYSKHAREAILAEAAQVSLAEAVACNKGLERRSARTGTRMMFAGIEGELQYTGVMAACLPVVLAATLIQVGGKTAFGFGAMEITGME